MTTDTERDATDGDVFDGDTGEHIATLENGILPATIEILHQGYLYVYKIDGKHKQDEDEAEDVTIPVPDPVDTTGLDQLTVDKFGDL